jgi:hypothetical protein
MCKLLVVVVKIAINMKNYSNKQVIIVLYFVPLDTLSTSKILWIKQWIDLGFKQIMKSK